VKGNIRKENNMNPTGPPTDNQPTPTPQPAPVAEPTVSSQPMAEPTQSPVAATPGSTSPTAPTPQATINQPTSPQNQNNLETKRRILIIILSVVGAAMVAVVAAMIVLALNNNSNLKTANLVTKQIGSALALVDKTWTNKSATDYTDPTGNSVSAPGYDTKTGIYVNYVDDNKTADGYANVVYVLSSVDASDLVSLAASSPDVTGFPSAQEFEQGTVDSITESFSMYPLCPNGTAVNTQTKSIEHGGIKGRQISATCQSTPGQSDEVNKDLPIDAKLAAGKSYHTTMVVLAGGYKMSNLVLLIEEDFYNANQTYFQKIIDSLELK
jgi:flagellar basal body-associated protein FliL